jgi:hypothetical protein
VQKFDFPFVDVKIEGFVGNLHSLNPKEVEAM